MQSKTIPLWISNLFVIKRTAMLLLLEFIGSQKIWLVGVGILRLKERDKKQTLITDLG
jgi:DNA polymerase IV (archaeal DinB-like DNA polymerase)